MHDQYTRSTDGQTDSSLMKKTWSYGCHMNTWKVKQSEMKATQHQPLPQNIMQQKYHKQKQMANT